MNVIPGKSVVLTVVIAALMGIAMALGVFEIGKANAAPVTSDISLTSSATTIDAGALLPDAATHYDARAVAASDAGPVAGTAVSLPDPVANPQGFASKVYSLYKSGALVPAIVLACFGICVALRKYVGWFSTGKQAAVAGAVIAGLTVVATSAAGSTTPTWNVWLAGITAAVALILHPAAPTASA